MILTNLDLQYKPFLFENDFLAFFPEIFLVLTILTLLTFGVIYTTSKSKDYPLLVSNFTVFSLLCLFYFLLLLVNNPIIEAAFFYNTLVIDYFTFFTKLLLVFAAFFSIFICFDYIKTESFNNFEYIILILLSTCGLIFLISSADFISMYLAIECSSLCFYVLAASKRNSEFSTEAGLKYFLLGAFSSGLLLFGCSLIYGFTGCTNFTELGEIFTCGTFLETANESALNPGSQFLPAVYSFRGCELGMIFLLVGFLFKLTAFPFHMWAPDVYEGAPTPVTAFFAITPKAALLAVFSRIFLDSFYQFMVPWQKLLIFCSIGSMILGAFAAMAQNKIKRLLAFSSIGHIGFLLIGFCCGTVQGIQAMLIYLVIYIIMNISLFALILSPIRRNYVNSDLVIENEIQQNPVQRIKYITDLSLVAKTNPIIALTLTTTLFSMAGIPPLAGFYSKAFLFLAAMSSTLYLAAIVGVLASVISCFYYIRLIKIMYFETSTTWCSFNRIPFSNAVTLALTFFFLLFFMIYPSPLYLITHKVALSLCC